MTLQQPALKKAKTNVPKSATAVDLTIEPSPTNLHDKPKEDSEMQPNPFEQFANQQPPDLPQVVVRNDKVVIPETQEPATPQKGKAGKGKEKLPLRLKEDNSLLDELEELDTEILSQPTPRKLLTTQQKEEKRQERKTKLQSKVTDPQLRQLVGLSKDDLHSRPMSTRKYSFWFLPY